MAHYFGLLIFATESIFISFSCINDKLRDQPHKLSDGDKIMHRQNVLIALGHISLPLCMWFFIKHHHHVSIGISVQAIATMPNEMTYFANLGHTGIVKSYLSQGKAFNKSIWQF